MTGIVVGGVTTEPRPSASAAATGADITCRPQSASTAPTLSLSAPEFNRTTSGLFGVTYSSAEPAPAVPSWLGPPESAALEIDPLSGLELRAGPFACVTRLVVTYLASDALFNGGDGQELIRKAVEPEAHGVGFGGIPAGDWVLRVDAHFSAQDPSGGELVARWFFRVVAAPGLGPTHAPTAPPPPTPAVTPLFGTCTSDPVSADIPVIASAGGGDPVTGDAAPLTDASPSEAPTLLVKPGDHVQIAVFGGCAVSWTIRLLDPSSLGGTTVEFQRNDNDDPSFASQNAWDVVVEGTSLLQAHLHFPGGPTIDRTWLLVAQPFEIPAAYLVAPDGTRGDALPGCGLVISLANGYNTADQCGDAGVSLGPAAFHVPAWTPITFEIPGWQLRQWSTACGGLSGDAGDIFTPTDGCDLGGGLTDTGEALSDPATFVLPPTDTIVVIQASAMSPNRDFFSVPYYIHVIAK